MGEQISPLTEITERLQGLYGIPPPPPLTDPFEMILWENVAYLVDDERRSSVFERLHHEVGTEPGAILATPVPVLAQVIHDGGMQPEHRAEKLQTAAHIALEVGLTELRSLVRDTPKQAKKVLKRFPGIGEPGADKILLFARAQRSLAPGSNALRVLVRMGFGQERGNYGRMYRSAAESVEALLPDDFPLLTRTHQLLRTHGQQLCKRAIPRCQACPLRSYCQWYRASRLS